MTLVVRLVDSSLKWVRCHLFPRVVFVQGAMFPIYYEFVLCHKVGTRRYPQWRH